MQGPLSLHQMRAASLGLERASSRSMSTDRNISDYHTSITCMYFLECMFSSSKSL